MNARRIREWLDLNGGVGSLCDLDLLLFFFRHSRVLLTIDQIAPFVGYSLDQVTASLETLLAAGLVRRERGSGGAVSMYDYTGLGRSEGSLAALLDLAGTRQGRLAIVQELRNLPHAAGQEPSNLRGRRPLPRVT